MAGRAQARPLLELAARAEALGYGAVWVGDSLLAWPRHEPLILLAGLAGGVPRVTIGTAVLLTALRNPVLLGHQVATLDQLAEGRLILGVGIARDVLSVGAEFAAAGVTFEKRVGRMMEGLRLCRALWTGEAVDWEGRWTVRGGVLAPTPYRAGGPPIWLGGNTPESLERAGRWFDGWFPNAPSPACFAIQWGQLRAIAAATDRDASALSAAMYLTLTLDDDANRAAARTDAFLEGYYGQPAAAPGGLFRPSRACGGVVGRLCAGWRYGSCAAFRRRTRGALGDDGEGASLARLVRRPGWQRPDLRRIMA